jgi:hypothetical protein
MWSIVRQNMAVWHMTICVHLHRTLKILIVVIHSFIQQILLGFWPEAELGPRDALQHYRDRRLESTNVLYSFAFLCLMLEAPSAKDKDEDYRRNAKR